MYFFHLNVLINLIFLHELKMFNNFLIINWVVSFCCSDPMYLQLCDGLKLDYISHVKEFIR